MILIEALHNIQSLFCGKSKPFVRIPLKFGQIIQEWRVYFFLFLFCLFDDQAVVLTFLFDLLSTLFLISAEAACFSFFPGKCDTVCFCCDRIVAFRHKLVDLIFSRLDHRKRRSLYPAAGQLCVIFAGQCSGRVDADQPVRFCAGHCCPV